MESNKQHDDDTPNPNPNPNEKEKHDKDDDEGKHNGRTRTIVINDKKYEVDEHVVTGAFLKRLAGIPPGDTLFQKQRGDDLVIANDQKVKLKDGDEFFSQPAADYGDVLAGIEGAELLPQADRWTFVVFPKFELPDAYTPRVVKLLVKLPPLFPQAQPDMFYLSPAVHLNGGGLPQATSATPLLGEQWQQFSWHLKPGAWRPGKSDFRDYMRCIRARLERRN